MDDPQPSLTHRKVPSSPREFFAKIYESSKPLESSREGDAGRLEEAASAAAVHPVGIDSFLWTPSLAAAAAQFHWNLVHNLSLGTSIPSTGSKLTAMDEAQQLEIGGFQQIPPEVPLPHFHIPPALNSFLARKRRRDGRVRRQRTTFSSDQTVSLEIEFQRTEYISRSRRCELAQRLALSETQIKIWFQNRRAKDKRLEKAQADQQVFNIINCYQTT